MNIILKDFVDFLTKTVYETDYEDVRISLREKMQEDTHIYMILGPQYVKIGLLTALQPTKKGDDSQVRFIVEEPAILQENTINDTKQLLEWALKHPKFKALEDTQRVRKYLLGFYGEQMMATPVRHSKTTPLPLPEGTEPTFENVGGWLEHNIAFNQGTFLKTLPDFTHDPNLQYGLLPIPALNHHLLCGAKIEAIKLMMEAFTGRGIIVRVSYMPVNLLREAFLDGMVEDYQRGLAYIYANRTLVAFGWNKEFGISFMRVERIPEDKAYRATVKDSLLGRAVIDITSAWQKSCRIKSVENMGLYFRELPGPSEMTLERTLAELFSQAKESLRTLDFRNIKLRVKEPTYLPAELDTLALVAD